jgi:DNA-binding Lrp family transcriptional regulator
MGRPKKEIDANLVQGLAENGCTNAEIARLVGCSTSTLYHRFRALIKEGRAKLNMSLRREQIRLAKEGNATMLIWLGKQRLGQRDRPAEAAQRTRGGGQHDSALDVDAAVRERLQRNEEYLAYLRDRAGRSNGHAGDLGGDGLQGPLADGPPPGGNRSEVGRDGAGDRQG